MVLYEYPFNESIRTMLRLEHLFKRLTLLVPRDEPVDHHFALVTVFEIMDVASDRKSTRRNSSHTDISRMPSSA